MATEVVAVVSAVPSGVVLDATVGAGGHASAILESRPDLDLVGLDQDPNALDAAGRTLAPYGRRVSLHRTRFDRLGETLDKAGVVSLVSFLFDLGVSSPQLDHGHRGFSYRNDGPLDMRMDPDGQLTADEVVNGYQRSELALVLRRNADERFATRIADAIAAARPLKTTTALSAVVAGAIPAAARRRGGHPAKRTFQAIRIEVNSELTVLEPAISQALKLLCTGGRGMVLTYHSGEDRIVKNLFRSVSETNDPQGMPVRVSKPEFTMLRPLAARADERERAENPRSSGARLRVIERLAA